MERTPNSDKRQQLRVGWYSYLVPSILCLCLVVVFIGVWNHVNESEQPPLYDPIMYLQKAKAFWDMVGSGDWKNPLNLQPVFRPPGTILMSYPFGFTEDFKGFLARSVMMPVLGLVLALGVAVSRGKMSLLEHLDLAAVALILTALPCFYHFEAVGTTSSPVVGHWGLVDNFFASVAALAFAVGYRSVKNQSWFLLVVASFTTGLCLMIKPAGTIVAAIIICVLFALMITEELLVSNETLSVVRVFRFVFSFRLLSFLITLSLGTILFFIASINSAYLSHDTIRYGDTAMRLVREDFASALSVKHLQSVLYPSFGVSSIVLGFTTAVAVIRASVEDIRLRVAHWSLALLMKPLLAAAVLAVGACFWLVYADLWQVRYFYPFAFVSLILMAIFLLDAIRGRVAPYTRLLLYASGAILFGSLIAMLYFPRIDPSWQRKFGVNLDSSSGRDARRLTDLLLHQARNEQRDLNVYCLGLTWDFAPISCWGTTEKILHPHEPSFNTKGPVDWIHTSVVHLEDLFLSDCILYHPLDSTGATLGPRFGDLSKEVETISSWLANAHEECGLRELATGKIAIKEVNNPKLFAQSFAKWAAIRHWRDVFEQQNADFLPKALPENRPDEMTQDALGEPVETFEQLIAIDDVQVETFSPLVFRVDWHAITENLPDNLYFFLHVLDDRRNILANYALYLNPRSWAAPKPLVRHHSLIPGNIAVTSDTVRYGFGVYQGNRAEKLLMPNPPGNDYGRNRVVRETQVR